MPVRSETTLRSIYRGFAAVRRHPLLFFVLRINGATNGVWTTAYFLGLPLMIEHAHAGLAAYGLVISAYGSTNVLGTLVIGNLAMPRRPARLIFAGNCLNGIGVLLMGAAGLLAPSDWLVPAFCAAAALGAAGGPMQDIMVATLRQTELPATDIAAAFRAFLLVSNLGILLALAAAPSVFNLLGAASGVMLCGAIYITIGAAGLLRFTGRA